MDLSPENSTSEYLDLPLREFLDLLASDAPAPGGGSVAAVAVALAAGLSGMAARLSAGQLADAGGLADRADAARQMVAPLAGADAESYGRVLDAYREPDSETRRERVSDALSGATDVPLAVAEVGNEVVGIAARLVEGATPTSWETRSPRSYSQKREYAPQRCWPRSICLLRTWMMTVSHGRMNSSTRLRRLPGGSPEVIDEGDRGQCLQYSLQTIFLKEG